MIKQDILYLSQPESDFSIGLNCSIQTIAIYTQNRMIAEAGLSPLETKVMQLFFQHFPFFVPDERLAEVLYPGQNNHIVAEMQLRKNISRILTQLKARIKPLDLDIRRISQTGYVLCEQNLPAISVMSEINHKKEEAISL